MATVELPRYSPQTTPREEPARSSGIGEAVRMLIAPLASLRLTVVLLALSLVLVLAGTLAQVDYDVWHVVHSYFRTWMARIPVRIFFPRAWGIPETLAFPFPGGKLIGLALAVNLLAAHGIRFKVVARGGRLLAGVLLTALGGVITWGVIASGANTAIESQLSASFTNGLWHALRSILAGSALGLAYALALTRRRAWQSTARWLWSFGAVTMALLAGLAIYLFTHPQVRLDEAGLRILWQLAKGTVASAVLGAGCWALFARRGGVVLLHSGIGLLMLGELLTAQHVVEAQMRLPEGATSSVAEDIRSFELTVARPKNDVTDQVTIIPGSLVADADAETPLELADLPFTLRIVRHMPNAAVRYLQHGEQPGPDAATAGLGQLRHVQELKQATGVEADQKVDLPATLVEVLPRDGGESRGVYLLRPFMAEETIEVDGRPYRLGSRFKRVPKEYSLELVNFKFDRYEGTETAKNYESVLRLRDAAHHVDVELSASMNNPIRYAGDTIYQSGFDPETEQMTILQIVSNSNWMIPYVACMIVLAGMLVHFIQALVRFVRRREDEAWRTAAALSAPSPAARPSLRSQWRRPQVWAPALAVAVAALWLVSKSAPPRETDADMKIHQFGALPVAYGGRTQPMDSLAVNALRTISGRSEYQDDRYDDKQPAIRWLLDVVTRSGGFRHHQVYRIENLEVLQALGLKPRSGFRYSIDDVMSKPGELDLQIARASEVPRGSRNLLQSKIIDLAEKVQLTANLMDAFDQPQIRGSSREEVGQSLMAAYSRVQAIKTTAPRPIPPPQPAATWATMLQMETAGLVAVATGRDASELDQATPALRKVLEAYRDERPQAFNSALAEYRKIVAEREVAERRYESSLAAEGKTSPRKPAERLNLDRIRFEAYFNHFSPFYWCTGLYIAAFLLAAAGWLGWFEGLNRTANWLLWLTFAVHTFGLICRIYISGRPPITNLYSSAVFIGWAGVLFALLFEVVYRLGVGNLLAGILGFPTLLIAHHLQNDGDTVGVMQAVLDTNFWLATHVVCITLGYATTLLAGALGLVNILMGRMAGRLDGQQRSHLTRMTYGTLCFAILFSFIGTVLGGLWADYSWGRFWGWDPKENGALMIVIWNAIVLHARWGKMIGQRGLAALAVLGNVVVAWSWFGVNQMGVGLHAYGFTEGRTFWVAAFMISQLAVVAALYLAELWRLGRSDATAAAM